MADDTPANAPVTAEELRDAIQAIQWFLPLQRARTEANAIIAHARVTAEAESKARAENDAEEIAAREAKLAALNAEITAKEGEVEALNGAIAELRSRFHPHASTPGSEPADSSQGLMS